MLNLKERINHSTFVVRYKRRISLILFTAFIIGDFLWFDLLRSVVFLDPTTHTHIFVFIVFFSIIISWKIRDIKGENGKLQQDISLYSPRMHSLEDQIDDESRRTLGRLEKVYQESYDMKHQDYQREKAQFTKREKESRKNLKRLGDSIDERMKQKQWNDIVESLLYFLNLGIAGYLALCVSTALIAK